ncbi:MAG: LysR family transcriptional regulator [Mesorhizobium sp.]|nr:LysR family transcriptional regulator [Mesorhizobium sp. M4A.F.Ca.ET.029.04.2.1]TIW36883.1 MAG: LysR family transcriptional regulator [Mesorhizobium sp.]
MLRSTIEKNPPKHSNMKCFAAHRFFLYGSSNANPQGWLMNYKQLEAFRAVMEAGTVTGASELLHIAQPSVSAHISNLEHALKIPLFIRRAGRLVPTAEAMLLNEEVGRIVKGMARIRRLAGDIQQLEAGRLMIGVYPALASIVLPRFLKAFAGRHPKARMSIFPAASLRIVELTAGKQIDLGLIQMPVVDPAIACDLIFQTECVCVAPLDHPFANNGVVLASQLEGQEFIALGREDRTRQDIERALDDAGVAVGYRFETPFADTACALVAQGLGVSIVDPFSAARWSGKLTIRPFSPQLQCHIYMTRNRAQVSSMLQQAFEREFRTALEENITGNTRLF